MAERRMLCKTVILSDSFLALPVSSRDLYMFLCISADDDGFVNNPYTIIRMIGSTAGDLEHLIDKGFVLMFEDGIIVVTHWKLHNYIQNDRYKETKYLEQKKRLGLNIFGGYYKKDEEQMILDECIQNVSKMDTQDRLGKTRRD